MDPSTSARSALHYALEEFRRPRGRPPKTWLSIMKQQLRSELNMNWNEAFDIAKKENVWKTLIKIVRCSKYYSSKLMQRRYQWCFGVKL